MAAIDFPNSPSVNDTHTVGDRTWKWNGSVWAVVRAVDLLVGPTGATGVVGTTGPTGEATLTRYRFTAAGSETSISGADDNSATLAYTAGKEQVYLNGVLLVRGQDYTASNGTSITGLTALVASDVVEVVTFGSFNVADAVVDTIVDAKGDLIVGTAADTVGRLAAGTNNHILTADSAEATGLKYAAGSRATLTTTGDIIYASAANTPARLAIGSTDQVLKVSGGIPAWGAAPSASYNYATHTPTYTNFTSGNGTLQYSRYVQIGNFVHYYGAFTLGSTSSVTGEIGLNLPVTAANNLYYLPGNCILVDAGTADYQGAAMITSTTGIVLKALNAASTYTSQTSVSSTIPFTWTNTDQFRWNIVYEAA